MVVCLLGIHLDLSSEDKAIKRELTKCLSGTYSELIRSDVPESSGSRSSRPATLRPSPPSVMKLSQDGALVIKPSKGELLDRVEKMSRKSRSVKQKTLDSPLKGRPSWGKVPKLGSHSSLPSAHAQVLGQVILPSSEDPEPQVRSIALTLLRRPKIPWEGLLSLRWRSCLLLFEVLLRRVQSLLCRGRKSKEGNAPKLIELVIHFSSMPSLQLARSRLSS